MIIIILIIGFSFAFSIFILINWFLNYCFKKDNKNLQKQVIK